MLPINLAATAVPNLLAALLYGELVGKVQDGGPAELAVLALVAIAFLILNFVLLSTLLARCSTAVTSARRCAPRASCCRRWR